MNIENLVAELERQKETNIDLVVDSRTLIAISDYGGSIKIQIPDYASYGLTGYAHNQMADKLGIPRKYYDRMLEAGKSELLAQNINAWIGDKEKRLVRIQDGAIRAILSDRYKVMDNYDLVFLALEEFKKKETIRILKAIVTETMLYIKAVDTTLLAEIREGDNVQGGLIIRNSEVGASAFRVEPFILRQICSNGLIGEYALKKVHLGRQTELGEIDWSDETRDLEDKLIWTKARDVIRQTFDRTIFSSWVTKLQESTEIPIEKPIRAANNIAKLAFLSELQKESLLAYFVEHTKYGLVNAMTAVARDTSNPDEQVRLEEAAGKVLNTEDEEFKKLVG